MQIVIQLSFTMRIGLQEECERADKIVGPFYLRARNRLRSGYYVE